MKPKEAWLHKNRKEQRQRKRRARLEEHSREELEKMKVYEPREWCPKCGGEFGNPTYYSGKGHYDVMRNTTYGDSLVITCLICKFRTERLPLDVATTSCETLK